MRIIERVFCLLGHHDWHIDKRENRYDPNNFTDDYKSPNWWGILGVAPAIIFVLIGTVVAVANVDSIVTARVFLGVVALGFTWGWAASLVYRHRERLDAICIRCGKKRMEFTDRKRHVENAKLFFASLREVEDDESGQKPPKVKA